MMTDAKQDTKKDKRIPWYFVSFFVGLVILNVIFVSIAVDSYPGLVTTNAYEKGLAYNDMIDAKEKQDALGWHTDITFTEAGHVRIFLQDKEGKAISDAVISAEIGRVINDDDDMALIMQEKGRGYYESRENFATKGQWNIKALIQWQQNSLQIKKRVAVK